MPYQDAWAICTSCGERFIFRVEDQRRMARSGEEITPPELCPACQKQPGGSQGARSASQSKPAARRAPSQPVVVDGGPREGSVKWFDQGKGYGFILDSSGEEIFFHRTGVAPGESPYFPDGTPVTYLIEQTDKGPQAVDVERMDVEESA